MFPLCARLRWLRVYRQVHTLRSRLFLRFAYLCKWTCTHQFLHFSVVSLWRTCCVLDVTARLSEGRTDAV